MADFKPANREWWIGRNNYAEGGTTDQWSDYEDEWVALRPALGFGSLTILPYAPPFNEGDAILVGELDRFTPGVAYAQGGERYYGFQYANVEGIPVGVTSHAQIAQATAPAGYTQPLYGDGTEEMYLGALGLSFQPDMHEPVPWERDGLYQ